MSLLGRKSTLNNEELLTWHFIKKNQLPPKGINVLCYGSIKMGADGFQKREVKDYFVARFDPWPDVPHRFTMRFTWFNAFIHEVEKWRYIESSDEDNEKNAA